MVFNALHLFGFLEFKWVDFIDILLVATLIYIMYKLVRGTIAFNIFLGLFSIYLLWWIVQAMDMKLLSKILGQFIGVGVVALLIVFQQEVRKFLLLIGQRSLVLKDGFQLSNIMPWNWKETRAIHLNYDEILAAVNKMARSNTGALIVLTQKTHLEGVAESGVKLDAEISSPLIRSIFFKNNPLHDGAIIIQRNKILSAACILPITENHSLPQELGLRHRAALGISEQSDAIVIVVSEERGEISLAENGNILRNLSLSKLKTELEKHYISIFV